MQQWVQDVVALCQGEGERPNWFGSYVNLELQNILVTQNTDNKLCIQSKIKQQ